MIEAVNQSLKPDLDSDILAQMQKALAGIESQTKAELASAIQNAGLTDPLREYYTFLGEERARDQATEKKPIAAALVEEARKAKREIEEKGALRYLGGKLQTGTQKTAATFHGIQERVVNISTDDLKNIGVILGAAIAGGTIGREAQETIHTSETILKNLLNSILSFSGSQVPEINGWAVLTGVSTGVVYLGIPWYLSHRIEQAAKHTEIEIARQRTNAELKSRADMAIANGEADLRYIVHDRPIFFIQVGKDDPSVRKFASTLLKI